MKQWLCLTVLMALLLSGCAVSIPAYTSETEPAEVLVIRTKEKIIPYTLYEVTTEVPDGITRREQYRYADFTIGEKPPTHCEYYENGELIGTETLTWDDSGNLVRAAPDWEGGQLRSFRLAYDQEGNLVSRALYLDDVYQYTQTYAYDGQGRVTELAEYRGGAGAEDLEGHLFRRTVTEYGEYEVPASVTVYDGNGQLLSRQEWNYAPETYRADIREYDAAGTLLRTVYNGYSGKNVLVCQEISDAEGRGISNTYWRYV